MAKQPRTKMSGKEALYIIKQNNINQAWLAEKLGITPQSLTSRLHAAEFSIARQLEINKAMGKRIFDVDVDIPDVQKDANRIPVFDMRVIGGFDIVAIDDTHDIPVAEYVTMAGLRGCVGLYVYGESMVPTYLPGDIIFVRKEPETDSIEWGRPYMIITKSERVLKCVYKSSHDATMLRLTSYNEDTNRFGDRLYPDREICKDDILYIYRVEAMFRRERM